MPISRDMAIFVLTTTTTMIQPITLPLAHARGVNMILDCSADEMNFNFSKVDRKAKD